MSPRAPTINQRSPAKLVAHRAAPAELPAVPASTRAVSARPWRRRMEPRQSAKTPRRLLPGPVNSSRPPSIDCGALATIARIGATTETACQPLPQASKTLRHADFPLPAHFSGQKHHKNLKPNLKTP